MNGYADAETMEKRLDILVRHVQILFQNGLFESTSNIENTWAIPKKTSKLANARKYRIGLKLSKRDYECTCSGTKVSTNCFEGE